MKRTTRLIVGGTLLVVLLGGAAYMGGRLLSGRTPSTTGGGIGLSLNGGKGGKSIEIRSKPAPELPQTEPDVDGLFDHAADHSLFVKNGPVTVQFSRDGGVNSSSDGPTVEIVVNQDTRIFKDTTRFPDAPSGSIVVQQTVAEGSLDEIGENSNVTAWGKRTGDRIVAEVLVYSQPPVMNKPMR